MCYTTTGQNSPMDGVSASSTALLLELAAADDLQGFRCAIEQGGVDVHSPALWYGPRSISKGAGIGYEMRTPLQVAALYGSLGVLRYILPVSSIEDVNRACGSDGATPLHCAAAGGAPGSRQAVLLLLTASADADAVDAAGRRPADLIRTRMQKTLLSELETLVLSDHHQPATDSDDKEDSSSSSTSSLSAPPSPPQRKEYPIDSTLPDIASGVYSTDEFRMYVYKVTPCSRAYSHDWTECPFAHPGENARRRDPRRVPYYSPAPCPEYRRSVAVSGAAGATCPRGDNCEFAHGVFESWLHPAQYRTKMCKDEWACSRKVCFFAHSKEELRQPPESMDFGVNVMMGMGHQQQQQGINDFDKMSFSPRAPKLHQQFLPSGYRTPIRSPASLPSSPRTPRTPTPSYGNIDNKSPSARASRPAAASAFAANRSLSFAADRSGSCGRAAAQTGGGRHYFTPSNLSGWGSADGRLDWGVKGEDLTSKLRKTPSFATDRGSQHSMLIEPDVSWVQSLVKDVPAAAYPEDDLVDVFGGINSGVLAGWATDPLYLEQDQLVA